MKLFVFVIFVGIVAMSLTASAEEGSGKTNKDRQTITEGETKRKPKLSWGDIITLSDSVALSKAMNAFKTQAENEETVLVHGKVDKVCKKKGCWMIINDQDSSVRVTFKDYGFFVPKRLIGQTIEAQGRLIKKDVSVAEQKHLLEDEGASKERIAAVTDVKTTYRFVADGVRVAKAKN
jgi:hypothetical protein